jgi:octopine/nopaline transport system substrate-binding protein
LQEIDFSHAYAVSPFTFAVEKSSPLTKMPTTHFSLDDQAAPEALVKALTPYLKDKKIAVHPWSAEEDFLNTYFKGIVVPVHTMVTCLQLQSGSIDATMLPKPFFVPVLVYPGCEDLTLAGPQMTGGLLGHGVGVGIRKTDPDLRYIFDKAIDEARTDGTLKRLSLKWFASDTTPPI